MARLPDARLPDGGARSRRPSLRPARFDDLGLRRALSDRLLPLLVGAMAFLAVLALAGAIGASSLAARWQEGATAQLTVQVPRPEGVAAGDAGGRLERVLAILAASPGIASARALTRPELDALLRPWLGDGAGRLALPLPAVVLVRLGAAAPDMAAPDMTAPDMTALAARLAAAAPGTLVERQGVWIARLSTLARSLQACATLALLVVVLVAAAVVAVATRAGLAARREAIEIVHGLGATDGYIALRFARRTMLLAAAGGAVGAVAAVPLLVVLGSLTAPFAAGQADAAAASGLGAVSAVPVALWLAVPALPLAAALIGWTTAQATVRRWLRRLP
jgi:cell division transport system permease protein